jgi:hypothetical protein
LSSAEGRSEAEQPRGRRHVPPKAGEKKKSWTERRHAPRAHCAPPRTHTPHTLNCTHNTNTNTTHAPPCSPQHAPRRMHSTARTARAHSTRHRRRRTHLTGHSTRRCASPSPCPTQQDTRGRRGACKHGAVTVNGGKAQGGARARTARALPHAACAALAACAAQTTHRVHTPPTHAAARTACAEKRS